MKNPLKISCDLIDNLIVNSHGKNEILLTTGFPILKNEHPETDGPLGIMAFTSVFNLLGFRVEILTNEVTYEVIESLVNSLNLTVSYIYTVPPLQEWDSKILRFLDEIMGKILLVISVETPSPNIVEVYHNMKGFDITRLAGHFGKIFDFLHANGVKTLGIGDGGNEIGFGKIREQIIKSNAVPFANKCRCPCGKGIIARVETSELLSASTSNFGAYALSLLLAKKYNLNLPITPDLEEYMLDIATNAGAVDGISGERKLMVDGIDITTLKNVISEMIQVLNV
ncbi:MAG: glutamate cyclase domain-containing protein [Candidatus Asgardarchaeia archaeon]